MYFPKKRDQEKAFANWVNASPARQVKYKNVLQSLEDGYTKIFPYAHALNYLTESLLNGVEMPRLATQAQRLINNTNIPQDSLLKQLAEIYTDYYQKVDQATMIAMLDVYKKSVSGDALPELYNQIQKKYKGDFAKYVKYLYDQSDFSSLEKITKAIKNNQTDFSKDPAILYSLDIQKTRANVIANGYNSLLEKISNAERLFENGIKAMATETGKPMYPDANSTMRLTFGK